MNPDRELERRQHPENDCHAHDLTLHDEAGVLICINCGTLVAVEDEMEYELA